jgi:hypothetical protein
MRIVMVAFLLTLSAGAFSTLVALSERFRGGPSDPEIESIGVETTETTEADETGRVPAAVASPEPAAPEPARPEAAREADETEPGDGLVRVPDFSRMTARRAFRRARELGLRADIRDEGGERVLPEDRLYLSVVGQDVAAGTWIAPGETVRIEAEVPRLSFAGGY